jgi:hypothetical protein
MATLLILEPIFEAVVVEAGEGGTGGKRARNERGTLQGPVEEVPERDAVGAIGGTRAGEAAGDDE